MSKTPMIIPARTRKTMEFPTLLDEADAHMTQAQEHYRTALQTYSGGASCQHLMHLAIVEQNAALLCHQEALQMMMAALIGFLTPDDDDDDIDAPAPPADTGGHVA